MNKFAETFRSKRLPLDILVCNAAAWMPPDALSPTEDGFEVRMLLQSIDEVY